MSNLSEILKAKCKFIDSYNEFSIYDTSNTPCENWGRQFVVVNSITGTVVDDFNTIKDAIRCINDILLGRLE